MNISTDVPLATLQQQLEAIRLEFQEFTSTVSHDLRAPLRHITAYVQVMTEDWPDMPQDMADHLATIRQSAQLLGQQLDGLTQLSRWGQQEIQLQAVNVSVMAQEVANTIMQNSSAHHVQWHLAKDVPLVWADADMLRTALSNLLGNAVKFSHNCRPAHITLDWHCGEKPSQCCICINDNGVGFAPGQAKALFKVFGKLHPVREFEGLGMGLVCSRKIIERLGGFISIEGVLQQGCRITMGLPKAATQNPS